MFVVLGVLATRSSKDRIAFLTPPPHQKVLGGPLMLRSGMLCGPNQGSQSLFGLCFWFFNSSLSTCLDSKFDRNLQRDCHLLRRTSSENHLLRRTSSENHLLRGTSSENHLLRRTFLDLFPVVARKLRSL